MDGNGRAYRGVGTVIGSKRRNSIDSPFATVAVSLGVRALAPAPTAAPRPAPRPPPNTAPNPARVYVRGIELHPSRTSRDHHGGNDRSGTGGTSGADRGADTKNRDCGSTENDDRHPRDHGSASRMASDAGYLVLIPLGAVAFHSLGRHPLAGLAAALPEWPPPSGQLSS